MSMAGFAGHTAFAFCDAPLIYPAKPFAGVADANHRSDIAYPYLQRAKGYEDHLP